MALLDLAFVTKTLVEIVRRSIGASPAAPSQTINVTSLPPDRLTEDNTIGIYLYHFVEDAAQKNQVWKNRPSTPNRFAPMALNLHYVLCAHSEALASDGPYREQLLMGLATKALHDYPIVDDDTTVAGFPVMPSGMTGDDNKLRITLRHVPANEAVSYWTAGSNPLRLSSYYEVVVAFLEPDDPATVGGRVLAYGVDAFVGGLPRLDGSSSEVTFTIPGQAKARTVEVHPAQVAIGQQLTLHGRALGGGAIALLVRGPNQTTAAEVGPSWGVSAFGDDVTATVQGDIDGAPSLAGTYAASVRITRTTTLSDGTIETQDVVSNETPFQIVPAVSTVGAASNTGVFTVTGKIFRDPALPAGMVRASIGGAALAPGTYNALNPGEFAVHSPTEIQMRLPAGAVSGRFLPVRVLINGSESGPQWVQVP
jgi:hypothetical protein